VKSGPTSWLLEPYFLSGFYERYKKVYNCFHVTYLTEKKKAWFGIWILRGTVLSTFTNVHVDLKDVPVAFYAITLL